MSALTGQVKSIVIINACCIFHFHTASAIIISFSIVNRLGSGFFGDVYLADAVGIACFDPRKETYLRHRTLLGRKRYRSGKKPSKTEKSSSLMVNKVAVKKLKGDIRYTIFVLII